jgi:Protein of unknown function (DUF1592)/Protein of unknown function (DUF1588)/Protein of unknown function (DUF1595)
MNPKDRSKRAPTIAAIVAIAGAACVGNIGDGGVTGDDGGASSGIVVAACKQGASFAPARLTLISDDQYRNIVLDVFGVTFPSGVVITSPPSTSGAYPYNEGAEVESTTVQDYLRAADQVAALLTSLPPCVAGAVNATCIEQYLRSTLPLAWRRPVTDDEISGLISIFNSGATDGQARQVQLTTEAMLIHPAFLYRSEIGTNAATATGKIELTPYELASAVSFAMLNSSPDAELWATAQDGSITQPAVLAAQVARLIAVPAVQANLMLKVSYYLDFEALPFVVKDPTAYPGFAALQRTLYQSSQMFLSDIMWSGHFDDLFRSGPIYANQAMAAAYGLPAITGTQLQPVTVTGDAYNAGVLTQPALLAASNTNAVGDDVIHRGLWVYYNLLCAPPLPPPPANASAVAATFTGSTRQQSIERDTTCGISCHGRFDPFGLVTLSYDGIGRYRTTDPTTTPPGGPIDDSATIPAGVLSGSTMPVTVSGVSDVAQLFRSGRQVSDCAADNLATYTLDHSPDVEGSCGLQTVKDSFAESGSFPGLFTSILTSPAFLTRDINN